MEIKYEIEFVYLPAMPYLPCRKIKCKCYVKVISQLSVVKFLCSFLPRDALVHSAVLRLHVVRPSVRQSVCLSVTLVDQDHIG